ncbi:hypothetical protein M9458_057350 [Cirrhinus mrigala]|uniref:Uncharacterized protein n=1 Tax=Cirrhinus mrigala TaxID=683832 RepID=A0ABD0MCC6_CIRMR
MVNVLHQWRPQTSGGAGAKSRTLRCRCPPRQKSGAPRTDRKGTLASDPLFNTLTVPPSQEVERAESSVVSCKKDTAPLLGRNRNRVPPSSPHREKA